MPLLQTLLSQPQSIMNVSVLGVSVLGLVTGLVALLFALRNNRQLQRQLIILDQKMLEQQEDYNKLEKLQFVGAQRQLRMDQVLQDIYGLIEANSRQLKHLKDQLNTHASLATDEPSQSNYEHAIQMAKEGLSGDRIQKVCGLTEGEVNLIVDIHQSPLSD